METSASFEARSAPLPYPTPALGDVPGSLFLQEMAIEIADKTISLISAAAVTVLVFERSASPARRHA